MRMCERHWGLLRTAIADLGMADLVAPDGETAIKILVSEFQTGSRVTNFDPLMAANNDIWSHAMDLAGLSVMAPNPDGSERCPICYCAELHAGSCLDDPCPDPRFDKWIEIAARHSKESYDELLHAARPDA